ncbi:MAG: family 20 glycosylhydrolase, partial [Bifidobacteriaceae bacterium]|nr:family 20 glycosylhydrolase [Bifidobacteriaceae bacterium]
RPDSEASVSQWVAADLTGVQNGSWLRLVGRAQSGSASGFAVVFSTGTLPYYAGWEIRPFVNGAWVQSWSTKYLTAGNVVDPAHDYRLEVGFETPEGTTQTVVTAEAIDATTGESYVSHTVAFDVPALANPGTTGFVTVGKPVTLTGWEVRGPVEDPEEPPGPGDETCGEELCSFDFRGKSRQDAVDAGWSVVNENPDNIAFGPDGVTVTAEAGELWGVGGAEPKNILTHPAPGDWDARAHVSTSDLDSNNEQALIAAYVDADNYVKVTRSQEAGQGVQMVVEEAGVGQSLKQVTPVTETDLWLRLVKAGDVYTGFYSLDGYKWTKLASGQAALADPDLALIHFPDSAAGDSTATFSQLLLNAKPFTGWPSHEDAVDVAHLPGVVASASSWTYGYYANGVERFVPSLAIDGGMNVQNSRWAPCNRSDNKNGPLPEFEKADCLSPSTDWWQVKLAEPTYIHRVVLHYIDAARPTEWKLQLSQDAVTWVTASTQVNAVPPASETVVVADTETAWQYIRVQGVKGYSRDWGTSEGLIEYGLSITEFEAWDAPPDMGEDGGRVLPEPVSQELLGGDPFRLAAGSRVVVADAGLAGLGEQLAAYLRPATGFALPVVTGQAGAGDIWLALGDDAALDAGGDLADAEGYVLEASADGLSVTAPAGHGLFNGFQTIRQLLPAAVFADSERAVDWVVGPIKVVDWPRYGLRGHHVDPARSFITVAELKAIIDELVLLKGNTLQIHLSDSQSWRLEIKGYETWLASAGNGGNVWGQYTQEDFKEVVAYANERFVDVIPELESPGHSSAATSRLPNVTCGTSEFCADKDHANNGIALAFWADVFEQLKEISPSEFIHIGGDEASTSGDPYHQWIRDLETLVNSTEGGQPAKRMIGWNPAVDGMAGTDGGEELSTSVNQFFHQAGSPVRSGWFDDGREVILSPQEPVYLDYAYAGSRGFMATLPYSGREQSLWNVFRWDPHWTLDTFTNKSLQGDFGLDDDDVLGVLAAIWGERIRYLPDIQYMLYPRLAAALETAWSPQQEGWTSASQDKTGYATFKNRLAKQGERWQYSDVNFGTIAEVPWTSGGSGAVIRLGADDLSVDSQELAAMAAPGLDKSGFAASVDWGDGTPAESVATSAIAQSRAFTASDNKGRSLMTVSGSHAYAQAGVYEGAVTFATADDEWVVPFTVRADQAPVDKAALAAAIAEAEGFAGGDCTADSWDALLEALAGANAVLGDTAATQGQVDDAVLALRSAIDGLELSGPDVSSSVAFKCAAGRVYLAVTVVNDEDV